jgi:hypothetical protein
VVRWIRTNYGRLRAESKAIECWSKIFPHVRHWTWGSRSHAPGGQEDESPYPPSSRRSPVGSAKVITGTSPGADLRIAVGQIIPAA